MGVVLEHWARPLLILHGLVGVLLLAACTHHLIWSWGYLRPARDGKPYPIHAEKRFIKIVFIAYCFTFLIGALMYPGYKVRVRGEIFDSLENASALRQVRAAHQLGQPRGEGRLPSLASVGRAFDIKEHWVALGLAVSAALLALSRLAHPSDTPGLAPLYVGLSALQLAFVASGVLIGLYTATFASTAGLGS